MNNVYTIGLGLSTLLIVFLIYFIMKSKKNKQLKFGFVSLLTCLFICCFTLLLQISIGNMFNIPPIYFDYIVYIGSCFIPICLCYFSFTFSKTKVVFKKWFLLLLILPIISLVVLWTNDFHHLFYESYSINISETTFGPYFYVYSTYSYLFIFIGVINLLIYTFKNSNFFSKQSLFFIFSVLCPVIPNILAFLNVIQSTIYLTPISFSVSMLFCYLAVFKFKFLSVAPIALQRIVDNISDGYIVLNDENVIIDFNKTFLTTFSLEAINLRSLDLNDLLALPAFQENSNKFVETINVVKSSSTTIRFEKSFPSINMFFNVEISSIYSNKTFLGSLVLFKDITQHTLDMQIIKSNQEMLMEKERLASLGQLIGGIAHNLKTPIMSISGAAEGLSDLAQEYQSSVDDPEVTVNDHHAIAKEMLDWIDKIRIHTRYMSDVITAVKGQAVALSENQVSYFTVEELIKHVNILMRHELKNALIDLNVHMEVDDNLELHGNINSLVQVINNIISNSIQAYNGKTNQVIDFVISKDSSHLIISIQDYASGMPKEVSGKLFKEMITTKGKNGTGLGLFMSYSNIRAHFNGHMAIDSEVGKGTTIKILLPL